MSAVLFLCGGHCHDSRLASDCCLCFPYM
jgi:hypothetical protein